MTVAELIAELQKHPPHAHVITRESVSRERYAVTAVEPRFAVPVCRGVLTEFETYDTHAQAEASEQSCREPHGVVAAVVLGTTESASDYDRLGVDE